MRWLPGPSSAISGSMPAPRSPTPFHCRNCGQPRADRYCARCGQDSRDHSRELKELFRDGIEHLLAFDLKSAQTFWTLMTRPGQLTVDWAEGRRMAWVSPFRLYLGASFLFYLALWLSGIALLQIQATPLTPEAVQAAGIQPHPDGSPIYEFEPVMLVPPSAPIEIPTITRQKLHGFADRAGIDGLATVVENVLANPGRLNDAADIWMPRILFALVPLCAGLFALFQWRRQRLFLDHLSFAFHLQSFIFVLSVAMMPIWVRTDDVVSSTIPGLIILGYAALAHRRVYGNALWLSGLKVLIVLSIYLILLVFGLLLVAIADLWHSLG